MTSPENRCKVISGVLGGKKPVPFDPMRNNERGFDFCYKTKN